MKNVLIFGMMIMSYLLIALAMFGHAPYDVKIHTAVVGLVGIIVSALLTVMEDYRQ